MSDNPVGDNEGEDAKSRKMGHGNPKNDELMSDIERCFRDIGQPLSGKMREFIAQLSLRDKAIILLLFDTGTRESEIANLRVKDVDTENTKVYKVKPHVLCDRFVPRATKGGEGPARIMRALGHTGIPTTFAHAEQPDDKILKSYFDEFSRKAVHGNPKNDGKSSFIGEFLKDCETRLSPSTVRNYTKILKVYEKFLDGKNVEDATVTDVRNFLNHLKRKGRGRGTIGCYLGALKSFYIHLEIYHNLVRPKLEQINVGEYRREPWEGSCREALSREEVRVLINAPDSLRDHLLITMLYYTGARASEIADLKLEDIDTESRIIKVIGKGYKPRKIWYSQKLDKAVELWLKKERSSYATSANSPYFFVSMGGKKLNRRTIGEIVHRAAEQSGIQKVVARRADGTPIYRVKPHVLRHSFATHAAQDGLPLHQIMRILGHSISDPKMMWLLKDDDEFLKSCYEKFGGV